MAFNQSPWLYQLDKSRTPETLNDDINSDVVIVGAGIAGISTAFFLLKYTTVRVTILERYLLAHGASGNNAGQVVSYFERGFASLVDEFGPVLAKEAQEAVDGAWELLDEMYTDAGLTIPFSRFMGHAGLVSKDQVLWHLRSLNLRRKLGLHFDAMFLSDAADFADELPEEYAGLYLIESESRLAEMLETPLKAFVAVLPHQKGVINSALLCQEMHRYLQRTYPDRYNLFEHSVVKKIVLRDGDALLDVDAHTVTAESVVLCTNGFEDLRIIHENGLEIDAKFHHLIRGKIGYMSAYLERLNKPPTAISYFTDPVASADNSYFYLTRRLYEYHNVSDYNLISVGGPEEDLDDRTQYSADSPYPDRHKKDIDAFVRTIYNISPNRKMTYVFTWHGLMGYTRNGVRLVGVEPQNNRLLYNLGCNGVGILPSVYGGRKIARHIAGEAVPPSIFDVPHRDGAIVSAPEALLTEGSSVSQSNDAL